MMNVTPSLSHGTQPSMVFVVGGGIMGLLVAIGLMRLARRLHLSLLVRVFEAGAFGGGADDRTAGPRSHLWLHSDGQFYARTQPGVCLALQHSTQRLRHLVPAAFTSPLALAFDLEGDLGAFYEALGVWHQRVPATVVQAWFPHLRLPAGVEIYRVRDAVIDLRTLAYGLVQQARRLGIEFVQQGVGGLEIQGETTRALVLRDGTRVAVTPDDQVVLACGAHIRPLLATTGLHVLGLRLFQSNLVASAALGLQAIFTVSGGVNIVCHDDGQQVLNVLGNAHRAELAPETDGHPLQPDPESVAQVCHDTEAFFGLRVPRDGLLSWCGVKCEIVPPAGMRSQAHHACLIPGCDNTWVVIPGKLSQAASAGEDLARKLIRRHLGDPFAWPLWETPAGVWPSRLQDTAA